MNNEKTFHDESNNTDLILKILIYSCKFAQHLRSLTFQKQIYLIFWKGTWVGELHILDTTLVDLGRVRCPSAPGADGAGVIIPGAS